MARIIYGVAGEGMGHATRSKILIEHLLNRGHKVKVVTHDKGCEILSPFFDVLEISGLRIAYRNNQVKYLETLFDNLAKFPGLQKSFSKVNDLFEEFQPQLVISDFEPLTALLANLKGLPLFSIDNLHQMTHTKISYPKEYLQDALTAKTITRLMVHGAKAYLITSFFKTPVIHHHTYLFSPVLRREVMEISPTKEDFVLIYTTSRFAEINNVLKKINENFIIYGVAEGGLDGNLFFKRPSQTEFLKDLGKCKAVIATAGLSLISEALYLGKPYLAIPVEGQFEQILNAHYLEKLGYGKFLERVTKEGVEIFLRDLAKYEVNLVEYKREGNTKILSKLDALIVKYYYNL